MGKGKSINLFLLDGDASGRMKCTLANWTGLAYKIPRVDLDRCKDRKDLNQSGVYFLFGTSDETGEQVVYVGQAGTRKNGEGILCRLQEHQRNPDKDYWTEAVVFTTSNDSFGPTEISYLENRFTGMAKDARRYVVKNENEPSPGHVTEEKECELEEFIEKARMIMGVLGHKVFEPYISEAKKSEELSPESPAESALLFCKAKDADASGQLTSEGFVVYAGSRICKKYTPSCPEYIKKLRDKYTQSIEKRDDEWVVKDDLLFSSPSAASGFVLGASSNGNSAWHTADGKSLKQLIDERSVMDR